MTDRDALRNHHLVIYLTGGETLESWSLCGTLERELRIFRELLSRVRAVTLVTSGGRADARLAGQLGGMRLVCNRWGLPAALYHTWVGRVLPRLWRGPLLIESTRVSGAEVAIRAAHTAGAIFVARARNLPAADVERARGPASEAALGRRALEGRVFRAAHRVQVTTDALRNFVVDRYGVPEGRVAVVSHHVDLERFAPDDEWARHPRRLCYVGRFDEERKNLKTLIEALEGLDVELCLIGSGPDESGLRSEALRRGVSLRVLGRLDNASIPAQLKLSAAFVLPSRWESQPIALLEAMACGMPVIGTDVPGVRELIRHRETGLLCAPTADSLREAISLMLGDRELRERLGGAARVAVRDRAPLPQVLDHEISLLGELAASAAESRREARSGVSAQSSGWSASAIRRRVGQLVLRLALRVIPGKRIEGALSSVATELAEQLSAAESLRFLFRLDRTLREMQGHEARKYVVEHGDGIHPLDRTTNSCDFFVDRINADDRVLDVRCGDGSLAHAISTRTGASVFGVDASALNIRTAIARHSHPRIQYRVCDMLEGAPDGEVDVVVVAGVLEHETHRSEFLSKLASLPGAPRLLVRVPFFERDWRVPLQRELGLEWRLDSTHQTEYTLESFAEEVADAGLSVAHVETRWGVISAEIS